MKGVSQLVWINDDTDEVKLSISHEVASEVKDLADSMGSSMTQSLILGASILNSTDSDELARFESHLDEQLESEGVPLSSFRTIKNKKSELEWREPDKYEMRAKLPRALIDKLEDNAPSTRRKGWWATRALQEYLGMPYESRFERIETKRQVLDIVQGKEVAEDEKTDVLRSVLASKSRLNDLEELLTSDDEDRVRRFEDASQVDSWDEGVIVLDTSDNLSDALPKTPKARVQGIIALARRYGSINSKVIDEVYEMATEDYGTEPDHIKSLAHERAIEDEYVDYVDTRDRDADDVMAEDDWRVEAIRADGLEDMDWEDVPITRQKSIKKKKIRSVCEAEGLDTSELARQVATETEMLRFGDDIRLLHVEDRYDVFIDNLTERFPDYF